MYGWSDNISAKSGECLFLIRNIRRTPCSPRLTDFAFICLPKTEMSVQFSVNWNHLLSVV